MMHDDSKGEHIKELLTNVFTNILIIFTNLIYLNFHSQDICRYISKPFLSLPSTTRYSSNIVHLNIAVFSFDDCLCLLDGHLTQSHTFIVKVEHIIDTSMTIKKTFNVVVVSVEYRLATEHSHPALSEDCYVGFLWTTAHAQELGIDLSQLSVMGISAVGGLAAAMALMARDRNGPVLYGQLLICPMLDDRDQTPSTHQFEGMGIWDRKSNLTGWAALLGDQKGITCVFP
ncbi:unnamed protein product [Rotaria sp. Silwood2]|nr:unnamed protein product [Rotaria sp. Silwood2]